MASAEKQKYRDQWENCVDYFQVAYRSDTRGPDAAESLYMIGLLFKGLSDKSHRETDLDQAMEYFQRVKRDFPGSAFADKAHTELGDNIFGTAATIDEGDPLASIIADNQNGAAAGMSDAPMQQTGLVTVQGLRFWSNPSYTRIVIDADQETRFSHRLLKKDPAIKKPQRLYVDLSHSRLGCGIQTFVPINDNCSAMRVPVSTPATRSGSWWISSLLRPIRFFPCEIPFGSSWMCGGKTQTQLLSGPTVSPNVRT